VNQLIKVQGIGSTDVDVEVPSRGIYAEVGGAKKADDLARFGSQLKILRTYAAEHGGRRCSSTTRGRRTASSNLPNSGWARRMSRPFLRGCLE
jgi:hypothetical protein